MSVDVARSVADFDGLDANAATKVRTALARLELGNLSNLKSVGGGTLEHRIHSGPGYRIYLGRDGERLIILLGGGTKRRQRQDIERALALWKDYGDQATTIGNRLATSGRRYITRKPQ